MYDFLVVTATAPVKTSLYIPLNSASGGNATAATLSASSLGVNNASQTTWVIQQGPTHSRMCALLSWQGTLELTNPHFCYIPAVTLVEGPTDAVIPIAPTAAIPEGGFVSCAFGQGSASCVEGATVSSLVSLVSTFTEVAAPTAVLFNNGGNISEASTTSGASTKSSRTSTAHPKHTGAAMRHSPARTLLVLLGTVLSCLAL